MAFGDNVARVEEILQPSTASAEIGAFTMTTPTRDVNVRSIDFSNTVNEAIHLKARMLPNYNNGGIKVRIEWIGNATSGNVEWEVSICRLNEDADLDTKNFASAQVVITATDTGSANKVNISEVTFTNGSQMDSWAVGELAVIEILRDQTTASDMAVDARILSVSILEITP